MAQQREDGRGRPGCGPAGGPDGRFSRGDVPAAGGYAKRGSASPFVRDAPAETAWRDRVGAEPSGARRAEGDEDRATPRKPQTQTGPGAPEGRGSGKDRAGAGPGRTATGSLPELGRGAASPFFHLSYFSALN